MPFYPHIKLIEKRIQLFPQLKLTISSFSLILEINYNVRNKKKEEKDDSLTKQTQTECGKPNKKDTDKQIPSCRNWKIQTRALGSTTGIFIFKALLKAEFLVRPLSSQKFCYV